MNHLDLRNGPATAGLTRYDRLVIAARARIVRAALRDADGNRTYAAKALGLERTYLVRLIRLYCVDVAPARRGRPRRAA